MVPIKNPDFTRSGEPTTHSVSSKPHEAAKEIAQKRMAAHGFISRLLMRLLLFRMIAELLLRSLSELKDLIEVSMAIIAASSELFWQVFYLLRLLDHVLNW